MQFISGKCYVVRNVQPFCVIPLYNRRNCDCVNIMQLFIVFPVYKVALASYGKHFRDVLFFNKLNYIKFGNEVTAE
jgi:hypothetical protein